MHRSRLAGFIIDCKTNDLPAAADFWSSALGLAKGPPEGDRYILLDGAPVGTPHRGPVGRAPEPRSHRHRVRRHRSRGRSPGSARGEARRPGPKVDRARSSHRPAVLRRAGEAKLGGGPGRDALAVTRVRASQGRSVTKEGRRESQAGPESSSAGVDVERDELHPAGGPSVDDESRLRRGDVARWGRTWPQPGFSAASTRGPRALQHGEACPAGARGTSSGPNRTSPMQKGPSSFVNLPLPNEPNAKMEGTGQRSRRI